MANIRAQPKLNDGNTEMKLPLLFKRFAPALGAAFLLSAGVSQTVASELPPLPQAIKDAGELRIGVKCDSPPFGASGSDGKPVGVEIDMAKQLGAYAFGSSEKAVLSCVATDARIPSLTGGKIDLILATLGRTPARQEVIDYSEIYYWGASNVIVPKDSAIQTLSDFQNKSMLIVKGGNQIKWLRENIPDLSFVQLNSSSDSIQALLQGRADGYAGDAVTAAMLVGNYPQLRIIDEEVDVGVNGIGLRKGDTELKAFVDAALKKMRDEKFFATSVKTHVTDPNQFKVMLKGFETAPPVKN